MNTPLPPDCFRREEVERFQSLENQVLAAVNYYLWLELADDTSEHPYRFLYAMALVFESGQTLLLSSGDDSEAIHVISEEALMKTAARLQELHGQSTIQRMPREAGFWQGIFGSKLEAIQLSRHENGLYRNDALMLDFGTNGVVVELLEEKEGLEIREI